MSEITAKCYSLKTDNGNWLGQIVLTSDGMFASVTDWGNLSFAWRRYGDKDFREFLISLEVDYFAGKMYQGNTFILSGDKCQSACKRYAVNILPALQKALKEELEYEASTPVKYPERVFTESDISQLQSAVHKITGDGEVMMLFNSILGINAGS